MYTIFNAVTSGQTAEQYFNISSHDYYSVGAFAFGLPGVESLYLNDTASAGYNWQVAAGTYNGYPAQVQGQIIDTGLTVTIGANTFACYSLADKRTIQCWQWFSNSLCNL